MHASLRLAVLLVSLAGCSGRALLPGSLDAGRLGDAPAMADGDGAAASDASNSGDGPEVARPDAAPSDAGADAPTGPEAGPPDGSAGVARLTLDLATYDFGDVALGSQVAHRFTLRNAGTAATTVVAPTIAGPDADAFVVTSDACAGLTLAVDAVCDLVVTAGPPRAGSLSASLGVTATAGAAAAVDLTVRGLLPAALAPAAVDFGVLVAGETSTGAVFTVENRGEAPTGTLARTLSGVDAADFTITASTCPVDLAPGGSCTITVQAVPGLPHGPKVATVTVQAATGSVGTAALSVFVERAATLQGAPATADFGTVDTGTSARLDWMVTNIGDRPAGPTVLTLDGANAADYVVSQDACSGASLGPGATCAVEITFAPTAGGPRSARLAAAAAPGGTVAVDLAGTGRLVQRLTVDLVAGAKGPGVVSSSPPGIACPPTCAAAFLPGTNVTLTATTTNGSGVVFRGWGGDGGDGAGSARTTGVPVSGPRDVTATFADIVHNLMFVSSTAFPTNLGSAAAYDARCNEVAAAAGLNDLLGTAYIAWLADDASSPLMRLGAARGFERVDGLPIGDSLAAMLSLSRIFNPIRLDEWGRDTTYRRARRAPARTGSL